jgi:hypothetical protein
MDVVDLPARKSDSEIAADIRSEAAPHFEALCKLMDRARFNGMNLNFSFVPDGYGRHTVTNLTITKPL